MNVILIAVIVLGVVGLVASVMLFAASKKFAVKEDERIGRVASLLPQANCGGCGYPGCAGFASACVKAADEGSLEGKLCPVGGSAVMEKVAGVLGMTAVAGVPKVAVVRCNGSCVNRPRVVDYDGVRSCRVQLLSGTGETACAFGCLGGGDCVGACQFGALHINPETGLPEVDEEKCTACGACFKACPRRVIELRPKGPKGRRMAVLCVNRDKGAVANKVCKASCIGCGKCQKTCPFEAITVANNLAYIDPEKCKLCRKCEEVCPKGSIHSFNFPPRKPKPAATPAAGAATVAAADKAKAAEKVQGQSVAAEVSAKSAAPVGAKAVETKPQAAAEASAPVAEKKAEAKVEKPQAATEASAPVSEKKAEVKVEKPQDAAKASAPVAEKKAEVKVEKPQAATEASAPVSEKKAEVKVEKPQAAAEAEVKEVKK